MFGQDLIVITSPLLTQLYTPEQFGLFAVFSAMSAIIGVAICLRYEFAVPVVKQEEDATALVAAAMLVTCLLSGALAVLLLVWGHGIAAAVGIGDHATLLWLLPPAMLGSMVPTANGHHRTPSEPPSPIGSGRSRCRGWRRRSEPRPASGG
jgi:O-antigen/teichoic acid export membrane protein